MIWITLLVLSAVGVMLIGIDRKKRAQDASKTRQVDITGHYWMAPDKQTAYYIEADSGRIAAALYKQETHWSACGSFSGGFRREQYVTLECARLAVESWSHGSYMVDLEYAAGDTRFKRNCGCEE